MNNVRIILTLYKKDNTIDTSYHTLPKDHAITHLYDFLAYSKRMDIECSRIVFDVREIS